MIAIAKEIAIDTQANNRVREIVEEMGLDGWSHSDTVSGCWDTRTVYLQEGVTLVFSRSVRTGVVRGATVQS
jgi:hypothetical protein